MRDRELEGGRVALRVNGNRIVNIFPLRTAEGVEKYGRLWKREKVD